MRAAIVGLSGPELTASEAALLHESAPAGVILFRRNVVAPDQLARLVGALRSVLPDEALVSVDQEGGRVARMRPPHWLAHPPAGAIGALAERDRSQGRRAAYLQGALIGEQARAAGFGMVFAPVLDLRIEGASDVVGDRSFGVDPALVAELGSAMAEGLMAAGLVPVGKHAPGHGRAMVDSHHALPIVPRGVPLDDDMAAFQSCRGLPCLMTAHIVYEALDPENPATLSAEVIDRYIRHHIGFMGLLVSDDLSMNALSGTAAERTRRAILAGCDIALECQGELDGTEAVLDRAGELEGQSLERWRAARGSVRPVALDMAALSAERDALLSC